MHIHGNQANFNPVNPYAAAAERAEAAARRAANVSKRLLKSASEIKNVESPEEELLVGEWMSSR